MKKKLCLLMLFFMLVTPVWASNPQDLSINIQSDGITRLDYLFLAEQTSLTTNISLLGETYENLFIVNEGGLPLEYVETSEGLTIYSLGSALVNLNYLTSELTGKTGVIWSLTINVPISSEILLPSGATIISLNTIPLEIDTVDERTVLIMPAGIIQVSWTLNIMDSMTLAEDAILEAENALHSSELIGVVVSEAEFLLVDAQHLYDQGLYLEAEEKASDTLQLVSTLTSKMTLADNKINTAESTINSAESSGRTIGLDAAESLLLEAKTAYVTGDYDTASSLADQALQAVLVAEKPDNNQFIIISALLVCFASAIYLYTRRKPVEKPQQDHLEFDLERLFDEHPELRIDDREVLRYLSENDGEAFAYDIRERFDLPRTSAWRMVRRLQRFEVVDERKIGGQSLISIKQEYRRNV